MSPWVSPYAALRAEKRGSGLTADERGPRLDEAGRAHDALEQPGLRFRATELTARSLAL
jgi:hypothetical protein